MRYSQSSRDSFDSPKAFAPMANMHRLGDISFKTPDNFPTQHLKDRLVTRQELAKLSSAFLVLDEVFTGYVCDFSFGTMRD
jgi:hypothetical protein